MVAFGLGLATTVTAVGLAAVRLGGRTHRGPLPGRLAGPAAALPVLGAAGVCVAGVVLVGISLG